MLEPLVLAYVGDEGRGLDIVGVLDQRLHRPIHLLTVSAASIEEVAMGEDLDAVVCGLIGSEKLQQVADTVGETNPELPVFDLGGSVDNTPESIDLYRIYPGESRAEAADELVGQILEKSSRRRNREPRTLGQYFALDRNWNVTDWDRRLESWTGIPASVAVGSGLWELFPGWEGTEFAEHCWDVYDGREPTTTELYHESVDRWFDVRLTPLDTGGLECFLRDITDYRESEKFEGPSERFENTLERITDAFFALDTEERFVLLNSKAEELLGVNQSAVTGMRFWDTFPAAMSTTFYEEFKAAMKSQEPTSFEEYYRPQESWFEVNAYPAEDGLSVFLRDVTEQIELQQKLESLHDITRELIVADSDTAIAEQTVDAAERILEFPLVTVWRYNDATSKLDPLAWSDAIDDRVEEMEPLDAESEFIWNVYESGNFRELGFVPATTSTSHHPGKVTSELLVPVGKYGVIGAYSDERDAFDEADVELFRLLSSTVESAFARTRRERQLAQRNERLNDFASVVSHDLRNPLNIASAHTELARDAGDPDDHLQKIDDSLRRMEGLIEDLLARAKGDQDLDREHLSLATATREAWDGVETTGVSLEIETDAGLDADRERLQQLFENLFRNAVEHGGENVRVGTGGECFFVADDGPGIPETEREKIFEEGVTYSEDGTGYGLAIVADIVDGHGWSVSVGESEQGGARFEISAVRSLSELPSN